MGESVGAVTAVIFVAFAVIVAVFIGWLRVRQKRKERRRNALIM